MYYEREEPEKKKRHAFDQQAISDLVKESEKKEFQTVKLMICLSGVKNIISQLEMIEEKIIGSMATIFISCF